MSNRRRAKPLDPWKRRDTMICQAFAGVRDLHDPELVAAGKKASHDKVIRDTGINRLSGVRWHLMHCKDRDDLASIKRYLTAADEQTGSDCEPDGLLAYLYDSMPLGGLIVASVVVAQSPNRIGLS